MSWRGTFRSIAAASRRIEREHQRQLRLSEKAARFRQKLAELEQAQLELEEFEETIARLTNSHRDCGETLDWEGMLNEPAPVAPEPNTANEVQARALALAFKPSVMDRILGRAEKKRAELNGKVAVAARSDSREYDAAYEKYLKAHSTWDSNRQIAHAILSGDVLAYEETLQDLQPFVELSDFGCRFNHSFHDGKTVLVAMTVNGNSIVPTEIKSLTSRGKLSVKKMPQSRFNELYQDYVCGVVLRVAREFFATLPLDWIHCTAHAEMLNSSTGYQEITPVVSVKIPRETLCRLNFATVDASDAMTNFVHQMGFKKGAGFTAIEPIPFA
jgi:hypothetical protein